MTMKASEWDRQFLWNYRAMWLPDEYMDGDTFTALVDTGFDDRHEPAIRLISFNAPERYAEGGSFATGVLRTAFSRSTQMKWNIRLSTEKRVHIMEESRTFARWPATVWIVTDNDFMIGLVDILEGRA
jgi:hypothetical protein